MRPIFIGAALVALAALAPSQSHRLVCIADGGRLSPPVASSATAWALVSADDATRAVTVYAHVEDGAGIHTATLRAGAATLVSLAPSPPGTRTWTGSASFSATDYAALLAGQTEQRFDSVVHPTGEIGGCVRVSTTERFACLLSGDRMIPPNAWGTSGIAEVLLHAPENVLTLGLDADPLPQPATLTLRRGDASTVGGSVVASLCCVDPSVHAVLDPLSAADLAALRAGDLYLRVDSSRMPAGEIRGQIEPAPITDSVGGVADGAQLVPPAATGAFGDVHAVASSDAVHIRVRAFVDPSATVELRVGAAGSNGPLVGTFGAPVPWFDGSLGWEATLPSTPALLQSLSAGDLYVQIATMSMPGGVARGQLARHTRPAPIGRGCTTSADARPRVSAAEVPFLGDLFVVELHDAPPGSAPVMCLDLREPPSNPLELAVIGMPHCHLFVGPLAFRVQLFCSPDGWGQLGVTIPMDASLLDRVLTTQMLALDGGANVLGAVTSNALVATIR